MIKLLELLVYLFRIQVLVGILGFELIGFNQVHLMVLVWLRYFGAWKLFGLNLVQEVAELSRHIVSASVGTQAWTVLAGVVHHLAVYLGGFLDVEAFLPTKDVKLTCIVQWG